MRTPVSIINSQITLYYEIEMLFQIWKPIEKFNGFYEISDNGLVKSVERTITLSNKSTRLIKARLLKVLHHSDGYLFVKLSKDGKTYTRYIHRLVAQAFIPNPNFLPEVNHISGDKTDNTPANLEWVSHQFNVIQAYRIGLSKNQGYSHRMAIGVIDNSIGQKFDTIKDWCIARGINYSTGRNTLSGWNTSKLIDLSKITLTNIKKHNSNEHK